MMRNLVATFLLLVPIITGTAPALHAQEHASDSAWLVTHYTKKELYIPMRDGKRLYTAIYEPMPTYKHGEAAKHPILMCRTPYSIAPYGNDHFKPFWNTHYMAYFRRGYIMVLQDVRGCYMSEGDFVDVRPYREHKGPKDIDESTDSWDTIDWLINFVKNNNGKVGVYGISYPGYYATEAALCGHPALRAVSPQAPVTEWFIGDDFHHNGAFMEMDAFAFYSGFGKLRHHETEEHNADFHYTTKDNYQFYLNIGSLKDLAALTGDSLQFWKDIYAHPNYDQFWQQRNTRNFVQHIPRHTATLVVGGLFDAEDCFGAWNLYKAIEQKAHNDNRLVMGPWSHGGWARTNGSYLGNVRFGGNQSEYYQNNVEIPFFEHYLEEKGNYKANAEATIFFTGANKWHHYSQWPPADEQPRRMYLHTDGSLGWSLPSAQNGNIYNKYTSDPAKPVPYADGIHMQRTREYMDDDQRFAARRPDVLVYQTDTLVNDITLAGPVIADLYASLSTTDADFVVKLIDVFPDDFSYNDTLDGKGSGKPYPMGGYQMLVRGDVMRGRYRNSFEKPEAFAPGKIAEVKYTMPDVAHVFKKGHRIMVQIQSTWFPLVDRNPQQFVNIYTCSKSDFVPCDIRIYASKAHPSSIILPVLSGPMPR